MSLGLLASAQAEITLEPAGIKVVWKSMEKEFDGFKVYNSSEGVGLTLVAMTKEKQFIGFLKKSSKASFMDGDTDLGATVAADRVTEKLLKLLFCLQSS